MSLKASLKNQDIYSFNFNEDTWLLLKTEPVVMACCGNKAILKKSKLGTLFFSHYQRGECTTKPETAEHMYLKNLMARTALSLGWDVKTEHPGMTPDGEKWVADVFCSKGNSQLIIEIQWSPQSSDEFIRRQKKYNASKIRAVWLYKLRNNKQYELRDLPFGQETPVFGFKRKSDDIKEFCVPQFEEAIEVFVEGMLQDGLRWVEEKQIIAPKRKVSVQLIPYHDLQCRKCNQNMSIVIGLLVRGEDGSRPIYKLFTDADISRFELEEINHNILKSLNIGVIKRRKYNDGYGRFVANHCIHCGAFTSPPEIVGGLAQYLKTPQDPATEVEIFYRPPETFLREGWYLNGNPSKKNF